MTNDHRITLLAIVCVAATLATFSAAVYRRVILWRRGINGVFAYEGNYCVRTEATRAIKQILLAYGTVIVVADGVRVILITVSILMALTSVSSLWHSVRLGKMMERYQF